MLEQWAQVPLALIQQLWWEAHCLQLASFVVRHVLRSAHKQGPDCCDSDVIWCRQKLLRQADFMQLACDTQSGRRHWQTARPQHAIELGLAATLPAMASGSTVWQWPRAGTGFRYLWEDGRLTFLSRPAAIILLK